MATKTPIDPREGIHNEEEAKPRFGLGHGDADSPYVNKDQARDLKNAVYGDGGKSASPGALDEAEAAGGTSAKGKVGGPESGLTDKLGKGFTGTGAGAAAAAATGNPLARLGMIIARNKKKSVGGAIVGLFVGIALFLLSIGQGPLQLIHLSQILQKNFSGQEDASSRRFTALFRYARTGDFGETRVGYFGSKSVGKTLAQLKEIGIEFPDRSTLGRFKTMTIDPRAKDSPYNGLSEDRARARIISDFELPNNGDGLFGRAGAKFTINVDPATVKGIKLSRALAETSIGLLEKGTVSTAIKTRVLARFFGLPNLFSSISKRGAAAAEKLTTKLERKKAEEERTKVRAEVVKAKGASARASLRAKLEGGPSRAISGALITSAGLCLVREVADTVVDVNRTSVVFPSVVEGVDKIAVGAQVQSGQNISLGQAGAITESFANNNGETIWDGKALDATAKGGAGKGKEIPPEYQQAFSNETTADNIKNTVKSEVAGVDVSGVICSTPGTIIQAGLGVGLLLAGPFTGGASWAVFAAKAGAGAAATAGAMYFLQKYAIEFLSSDAIVPVPPSGPLGGNIMAYGAREAANISFRSSGGVELDDSETAMLDKRFEQRDQEEFNSKNFLARMFDVHDYRSLASRTIDRTNTDSAQNISSIASSLFDFGGMASSIFSTFTPKASAQAGQSYYDWGFPRYGIPGRLLNDSDLEDPYENAERVDKILKLNDDYIDRAKRCFGVEIGPGPYGLDAVATEEVNPNSDEYLDSDCNHTDDLSWRRIIMFIFDTRTVTAAQCYDGDEDACSQIGFGDAAISGSPDGSGVVADAEIDLANIQEPSVDVDCAPGTNDLGVQDGYTEGTKVKIRICAVPNISSTGEESNGGYGVSGANGKAVVNSRVSGAFYALAKAAQEDGIDVSAISSFRTMSHQQALCSSNSSCAAGDYTFVARPGTSNHQLGVAVDFSHGGRGGNSGNCINIGGKCTLKGDKTWEWLDNNARRFGLKQYSAEFWHWSPLEN